MTLNIFYHDYDVRTYVFGMFRIARCLKNIIINVPLPTTPTINMMQNINGTM